MAGSSIFDTPSLPRLPQLIEEVRSGKLLIPAFQRPFEWDDDRRIALLDSIAKGVPIGALMIWRTDQHDLQTFSKIGPFPLMPPRSGATPRHYLIDGHQRLTTIFAALSVPPDGYAQMADASDDGERMRWIDVELSDPSRPAFVLRQVRGRGSGVRVPVEVLLQSRELWERERALLQQGHDGAANKLTDLRDRFRDYQVPVVVLATEDMDLVTQAFVRVNSGGVRMSLTNLVHSLVGGEVRFRSQLQESTLRLTEGGWPGIGDDVLLPLLKLRWGIAIHADNPEALVRALKAEAKACGVSPEATLRGALEETEGHLRVAVQELEQLGVCGVAVLPYVYHIICLAEAARITALRSFSDSAREAIRCWFWATTFTGYFTGRTSRRLREAVEHGVQTAIGFVVELPLDLRLRTALRFTYNFNATRTRAALLAWACGVEDPQERARLLRLLGTRGSEVVVKIAPALPRGRLGSWMIADGREDVERLHRALALLRLEDREWLDAQAITYDVLNALREERWDDVVTLREEILMQRERIVLDACGLGYEEEDGQVTDVG